MTNKENLMRMLLRQGPEWVPCWRDSCVFLPSSAIEDRAKGGSGTDWFGGPWIDMTPAPGQPLIDDITQGQEKVRFPDLDSIDWAAAARRDGGRTWGAFGWKRSCGFLSSVGFSSVCTPLWVLKRP